jgi:hypothetical protein
VIQCHGGNDKALLTDNPEGREARHIEAAVCTLDVLDLLRRHVRVPGMFQSPARQT